jgi:hypothetical protein
VVERESGEAEQQQSNQTGCGADPMPLMQVLEPEGSTLLHLGCAGTRGFGHLASQGENSRAGMIVRMILIGNAAGKSTEAAKTAKKNGIKVDSEKAVRGEGSRTFSTRGFFFYAVFAALLC